MILIPSVNYEPREAAFSDWLAEWEEASPRLLVLQIGMSREYILYWTDGEFGECFTKLDDAIDTVEVMGEKFEG